jgi:hypothetical protein
VPDVQDAVDRGAFFVEPIKGVVDTISQALADHEQSQAEAAVASDGGEASDGN